MAAVVRATGPQKLGVHVYLPEKLRPRALHVAPHEY